MEKERLITDLLNTKTTAKVRRQEIYIDNDTGEQTTRFTTVTRDTYPIDFPVHPGEFVLKRHEQDPLSPLSPYYINLRNLPEDLVLSIAQELAKLRFSLKPDVVAGIPDGAVPFAKKYSKLTGIPYEDFLIKEERGGQRYITSKQEPLKTPKKLLLIEDVISEANSCREAIRVSRSLGYEVTGIAGIFDREQGGVQLLEKLCYETLTILQLTQTMEECKKFGRITIEQFNAVMNYT